MAREMVVTGDYVTLHVNGVRYLEKAPLPYWLVAISYKVFGVNEFSTRLPMVLSVMLLGVLGWLWGRRAFGERSGIYAALFAYTCAGVYLFTRVLIPEVLLSLLIAAALYFFLTALEPGAAVWRWYDYHDSNGGSNSRCRSLPNCAERSAGVGPGPHHWIGATHH